MHIIDEAELRAQTILLYKHGGYENVMDCIQEMMRCERVMLEKLQEIMEEEANARRTKS